MSPNRIALLLVVAFAVAVIVLPLAAVYFAEREWDRFAAERGCRPTSSADGRVAWRCNDGRTYYR